MTDSGGDDRFRLADSWRGRGLALLQFIGFFVVILSPVAAVQYAIHHGMPHPKPNPSHAIGLLQLVGEFVMVVWALTATWIMARVSRKPFLSYGLGGDDQIRNFVIGTVAGIVFIALILFAMNLMGVYDFGTVAMDSQGLAYWGLVYAGVFVLVAFAEETITRGYALVSLSRAISFWPAAIVLSAMFGAAHLGNHGENWIGILTAAGYGFVLAYSFRATGSLWFALGLHAGNDYAETYIFGVPDSGLPAAGRALVPSIHGPEWLSGGSVGPEGSIVSLVALLLLIPLIWALRRRTKA